MMMRPVASPPRDPLRFRPTWQHTAQRASARARTPPAGTPAVRTPRTHHAPPQAAPAPAAQEGAPATPPEEPLQPRGVDASGVGDAASVRQAQDDRRFLLDVVARLQRCTDPSAFARAVTSAPGFAKAAPLVLAAPEVFGGSAASAASVKLTNTRNPAPAPRRLSPPRHAVPTAAPRPAQPPKPAKQPLATPGRTAARTPRATTARRSSLSPLRAREPPTVSPFMTADYAAAHRRRSGAGTPATQRPRKGGRGSPPRSDPAAFATAEHFATDTGRDTGERPQFSAAPAGAGGAPQTDEVRALLETAASLQALSRTLHAKASAAPATPSATAEPRPQPQPLSSPPAAAFPHGHLGDHYHGHHQGRQVQEGEEPSIVAAGARRLFGGVLDGPGRGPSVSDRPSQAEQQQRWAASGLRQSDPTPGRPAWDARH